MKGGQMPDSMLTALSDRPPDLKICHFLIKIHLRPDRQKGQTMKIINNSHKKQQNIKKVELYKISFKNRRTPPFLGPPPIVEVSAPKRLRTAPQRGFLQVAHAFCAS